MILSVPRVFSEMNATAWRLASGTALLLAVVAIWISPEFSLINLGASLTAGLISLLLTFKKPRGLFALWCLVLAGFWLSPLAGLAPEARRLVFATVFVFISLVYQGSTAIYFGGFALSLGLNLRNLGADFSGRDLQSLALSSSVWGFELGLVLGLAIYFARVAHTRSTHFDASLKSTSDVIEKTRGRVSVSHDNLQMMRERLLGRTLSEGEPLLGDRMDSSLTSSGLYSASFDDLIATLRKSFSDFQLRGRAAGRIAGPVRFVFFTPVGGYDEKSVIAVDLAALVLGLGTCLDLALESLPEVGARKREGVIRLSIRYGLRVIEVAVEDNGRGLASRHLATEANLVSLKDLVQQWGGKFDRITRLGVGSRTALELRILRERTRSYRATLRHPPVVGFPTEDGPRG